MTAVQNLQKNSFGMRVLTNLDFLKPFPIENLTDKYCKKGRIKLITQTRELHASGIMVPDIASFMSTSTTSKHLENIASTHSSHVATSSTEEG